MKVALGVEYDGRNFSGWQKQPKVRTIQFCLEKALSKVADETVNSFCAGRTDAGVHALEQVIHFEVEVVRTPHQWLRGTNTWLPPDVRVLWASRVSDDFHARFSAIARHYQYIIYNHPIRPALRRHYVTWQPVPLDARKMHKGAQYLIGEHDFSSYRAKECQSQSAKRHVHEINISRHNECVIIDIKANAFLHHMVRNIVGVLMEIGMGKRPPDWSFEVLQAKDRKAGGITAAPTGLYFVQVEYPGGDVGIK